MAIEFRCSSCNKLLRTGDETAGKKAKCPSCGAVVDIPMPPLTHAEPSGPPATPSFNPFAPPSPGQPGPGAAGGPGGPFGGDPSTGGPFGPQFPPGPPRDSENPYQSPAAYPESTPRGAAAASSQIVPTEIAVGDVLNATWAIFKDNMWPCLRGVLVVWGFQVGLRLFNEAILQVLLQAARDINVVLGASAVLSLLSIVISMWVVMGQIGYFLKIARGQEVSAGEIFQAGPFYFRGLRAMFLVGLIVLGGSVLCLVPGAIFFLMFSQVLYVILDRNVLVMDSLRISRQVTDGNKLTLFGMYIVLFFLNLAGFMCFCVGSLFTSGFIMLASAVAYLSMTGQRLAPQAYQGGQGYEGGPQPPAGDSPFGPMR